MFQFICLVLLACYQLSFAGKCSYTPAKYARRSSCRVPLRTRIIWYYHSESNQCLSFRQTFCKGEEAIPLSGFVRKSTCGKQCKVQQGIEISNIAENHIPVKENICPPLSNCQLNCLHGRMMENDCEICECYDPCEHTKCEPKMSCKTIGLDCTEDFCKKSFGLCLPDYLEPVKTRLSCPSLNEIMKFKKEEESWTFEKCGHPCISDSSCNKGDICCNVGPKCGFVCTKGIPFNDGSSLANKRNHNELISPVECPKQSKTNWLMIELSCMLVKNDHCTVDKDCQIGNKCCPGDDICRSNICMKPFLKPNILN